MIDKLSIRQKLALEVNRKIYHNLIKLHPLKQLFWECTQRCNVHCKHCGSDCKSHSSISDMPANDFLKTIDSITPHVNPHEVSIVITGGEPLMRNDIEYVGRELYNRGYPWGMVTNGLYLDEKRMQSLMSAGMHSITVSLDGFEEAHNWLRGNSNSFNNATNAIRLIAKETELKWDVVTCVNLKNYDSLNSFKEFLYEIGVRSWRLLTIFPMGRAKQYPEFQLNKEKFIGLMDFIENTRKEGKINANYGCEGFLGSYEGKVRDYFFGCRAGITVGSILIDGSIGACASIRSDFNQGNIYQNDFWDVWENKYKPFRDHSWMKRDICADCKMFRYCEGNGMHLRQADGKLLLCHLKK